MDSSIGQNDRDRRHRQRVSYAVYDAIQGDLSGLALIEAEIHRNGKSEFLREHGVSNEQLNTWRIQAKTNE